LGGKEGWTMPLARYDKYYGGKGGAAKAHAAMVQEYGKEKAERIFYATLNKKRGGAVKGKD
jgi:hypothetical protein